MARGDHIYRDGLGGVYTHHGIDLGDGRVIQYSGLASPGQLSGCVSIVSMEEFAADCEVKPFLYPAVYLLASGSQVILDIAYTPEEIVERALSREGENLYDVFRNNCEHFCHWAVCGEHQCGQLIGLGGGDCLSRGTRPSGGDTAAAPCQRPEDAVAAIMGRLRAPGAVPDPSPVALPASGQSVTAPDHSWLIPLRPFFEQLDAIAARHQAIFDDLAERQALAADMAGYRIFIPLVGAFSTGKTTLLNVWLGGDVRLPASLEPTTRTPLELTYGPEKLLLARDSESGGAVPLPHLDPSLAPPAVQLLELQLPSPVLSPLHHCSVVDLPGLDSGHASHDAAVARYAPRAAAFVLVVDGERLLTETVLRTLDTLRIVGTPVRVLLTKADLFSPGLVKEKVSSISSTLAPRLGDAWDGEVHVTAAGRGNVAAFDQLLHQLHDQGPRLGRRRFAVRLLAMARRMKHSLIQFSALQQPDDEALRRVRHNIQGEAAKLRVEMENFRDDLRRQIDRVLEDIRFDLEDSFADRAVHYAHVTDAQALNESLRKMAGAELRRLLETRLIPAFAAATRTSPREVEAGLANLPFAPGGDALTDLIARGVGWLSLLTDFPRIPLPIDRLLGFLTGQRNRTEQLRNQVMPQLVSACMEIARQFASRLEDDFMTRVQASIDSSERNPLRTLDLVEAKLRQGRAQFDQLLAQFDADTRQLDQLTLRLRAILQE